MRFQDYWKLPKPQKPVNLAIQPKADPVGAPTSVLISDGVANLPVANKRKPGVYADKPKRAKYMRELMASRRDAAKGSK